MEFSPLYTRRLSGSSSLSSFKEDALEQLEFNINDISRASSPASVISISARSEGHGSSFRDRRYRNSGRGDDEYRKKYSKIKAELELERIKARQLEQERIDEMRKWKDAFENDRKLEISSIQKRMEDEKKREIARLKEELIKQKDFELQQVLIYRESEKRQQQLQSGHRVVNTREKEKKLQEQRIGEREKIDFEENEESAVEKDGDNDVAMVSEKARVRDGNHHDDRRKHRSTFSRRSVEMDPKDGGPLYEHRRSSRESKTPRSHDGYEADKESGGARRRGSGAASRLVEKVEKPDVATAVDDDSLAGDVASDNTASKKISTSARMEAPLTKDAITSTKGFSPLISHKSTSTRDLKDSPSEKNMIDEQTQVTSKMDEETENKEKERQLLVKELGEKITNLEYEKSALLKEKAEIQKILNLKSKEHKKREEEFISLKAGYDREFRTVINEHKKLVLGNLEKLKLAETVLKESTLSEEEIAILSQRTERQRRLSTSSLPALQFQGPWS